MSQRASITNAIAIVGIAGLVVFILATVATFGDSQAGWWIGGIVLVVVLVLAPAYLGDQMGRDRVIGGGGGFALGLLLGWLGIAILLCLPYRGRQRKCPACAELVKAEATKCRWCGERLRV